MRLKGYKLSKKLHIIPIMKPPTISLRECCRNIIRAVPASPATIIITESHHRGLNWNISETLSNAPVMPPIPAMCIDTFHHTLMMAHATCIISAVTTIFAINCGIRITIMR